MTARCYQDIDRCQAVSGQEQRAEEVVVHWCLYWVIKTQALSPSPSYTEQSRNISDQDLQKKVKTSDQLTGLVKSIDGSHTYEAIGLDIEPE